MEAASAPQTHGLRIARPRRLLAALSDERLIEHVRRGEAAAFEVLYDRHSAGILGFCRHMLRSQSDAEDAVQHTFIAAHADIQRSGERNLHVKAWLYTIARNRCLSMLRARREQVADDDVELVTDGFEHDLERREDLRALLADVRQLPADQREALVLAELGDLAHGEIAAILGCEAAKVKSLVFQARSSLIDRKVARETPCEEIREQIASLRGGALRRSHLRHHLAACPGCAAFREDVRKQRAMLALALPVVPSAALKASVLGSIGIGGGSVAAGGSAVSGTGLAMAAQSGLAKLGIAAVVLAGAGGGAAVVTHGHLPFLHRSSGARQSDVHGQTSGVGSDAAAARRSAATRSATSAPAATKATTRRHGQRDAARSHGFTPTTGGSNGAAARQFAATRGKGKHLGISKTHNSGASHRAAPRGVAAPRVRTAPTRQAHGAPVVPQVAPVDTTAPAPTTPKTESAPASAPTAPTQPPAAAPTGPGTGGRSGAAHGLAGSG